VASGAAHALFLDVTGGNGEDEQPQPQGRESCLRGHERPLGEGQTVHRYIEAEALDERRRLPV
jgi:hypothetical protein